jgi:hypothetical protein
MKKKTFIWIGIIIIFYFLIKGICLIIFMYDFNDGSNGLYKQGNNITILKSTIKDDNSINFLDAKIGNFFTDMVRVDTEDNLVIFHASDNSYAVMLSETDSYFKIITDNFKDYRNIIPKSYFSFFMNRNKITDDISLFNYLNKYNQILPQNNIFTPIYKMMDNSIIAYLFSYRRYSDFSLINGDFEGYTAKDNKFQYYYIKHNDKYCCISFINLDYYNEELQRKIVSTLQF